MTLTKKYLLTIQRIIYNGKVVMLEPEQMKCLPLDAVGAWRSDPFHSGIRWATLGVPISQGSAVNPGDFRRRYLHPAAKAIGVKLGGTHDFRRTLKRRCVGRR